MKSPKRFVGLHAHSGFSTFDGLDYPQDHIDYVRDNGMDAWALTDHGHMNGFCHAYTHTQKLNKAGANFKFIPGCEMYVHPDLNVWRIDYELRKAAKSGDKDAQSRLLAQREAIATPLLATVDNDDEIIDVSIEDASMTVENEDETKSSKFYDAIKRRHHLVVLPKTSVGLERLFGLVSRGYLDGFYRFPRVDYGMLKEAAAGDHLMVSSACIGGPLAYEVFKHLQQVEFDNLSQDLLNDPVLFEKVLTGVGNGVGGLVDAVGRDNVYLELQFNKLNAQHLVNRAIIEFANREGMQDQLIVTCDSHYSNPDHWRERELYKKLGWLNYKDFDPDKLPKSIEELKCELYPKNAQQVWETYHNTRGDATFYDDEQIRDAIERTHDIAHNVIGDIHPDVSMKLPSYVVPEGKSDDRTLLELCITGLKTRGFADNQEYIDRLKYELRVIKNKNFSRYFLTMHAIINIAKKRMLVGPGRGSAAASLVAYVLELTNIDPIEYGLMFERFLNPSRKGAPDIDTDVSDRDLLIELLRAELGERNVIPISNYNTFKLKSLVKDVSRFYGIPFQEVNKALKTVETDVKRAVMTRGQDKNLFVLKFEDAVKHSPTFRTFIEKYPDVGEPIEILFQQNKALGRHAGGVIISENIAERMPVIMARGELQTPWVEGMQYKHLEEFGWIKFDLLGLETLRLVERTISLILRRHHGVEDPTFDQIKEWFDEHMDPKVLDMNDQKVYDYVYRDGHFAGVFQLTSSGSQKLFKRAQPKNIVDIATLTAIYRPGPLSAKVDRLYVKAKKNPAAIDYGHPLIKEVLEETYGMIVFQEQVMKLCAIVAGFPEAETDTLRRNIMKRKGSEQHETLAAATATKKRFVAGAVKNGVPERIADELYEKILYFAGYGFNRAHSVSYAVDSYYCAWLHTYYEEEWMCAYLESMSTNDKKRARAFAEAKAMGYKIVPLDVNHAEKTWTILEGKKFMPSFLTCKGIGSAAIDEILQNRPYNTIDEFLWNESGKWRHSKFNKRALEALIGIKAFGSMDIVGDGKVFESYRQMHSVVIEKNNEIKKWTKKDPERGQRNFRELCLETAGCGEWTRREVAERSTKYLGSFNAGLLIPQEVIDKFEEMNIRSLDEYCEKDLYWFLVADAVPKLTKNGRPYLIVTGTGLAGARHRMFCWSWDGETQLAPYCLCVAEMSSNDFGYQTSMKRLKILSV